MPLGRQPSTTDRIYGVVSILAVRILQRPVEFARDLRLVWSAHVAVNEVWGLFVDDGALATAP